MLQTLPLVPFVQLRNVDITTKRVIIAYDHKFIPSLVLLHKCPPTNIGYYSHDPVKAKFSQMFKVNEIYDLEYAMSQYDYIIVDGLMYELDGLPY
jgi:hypothetical protein